MSKTSEPAYSISGLVVHVNPERAAEVSAALAVLPGVEVHADDGEGKLVVTSEEGHGVRTADIMTQIGAVPGVLSVALVYHHFE